MGAGAAFRPRMIRWKVAQDMGVAWLITIPASGLMAAAFFSVQKFLFLQEAFGTGRSTDTRIIRSGLLRRNINR
jgi:hypothetical protein